MPCYCIPSADEGFSKGYVVARDIVDLWASVDYALDRVAGPLCDWDYLHRTTRPPAWLRVRRLGAALCSACVHRQACTASACDGLLPAPD